MIEQKYIQTAIDYKKNVAGKFVLVEGAKLKQRIDGHMQVVFFVDGQVVSSESRQARLNGRVVTELDVVKCLCSMPMEGKRQARD